MNGPTRILPIVALLLLAAMGTVPAYSEPATTIPLRASHASERVPGQYIVLFNERVSNPVQEAKRLVRVERGELRHSFQHGLRGFAARLPPRAVERIRQNPNIELVVEDITVHAFAVQQNPTWGLDRIDQRALPLDMRYQYNNNGAGVYAYILDTGIRSSHAEFQGRVASGFAAISDDLGTEDCNGHGTHVAGTVGGQAHGVAKAATLVPVRVLDCNGNGTVSDVIAGIDWVVGQKQSHPARAMVANISLGGGTSPALDQAVRNAVSNGVAMVVAAGNANSDACGFSPAREPAAFTVGATTRDDTRAWFSNFGTCVDMFAPGAAITSAYHSDDTVLATSSGTSMAAPHVTGVAALILASDPAATVAQIHQAILDGATSGVVHNAGIGSPNRLLNSLAPLDLMTSRCDPGREVLVTQGPEADKTMNKAGCRIAVESGVSVPAKARLNLVAGDRIVFRPGVRVASGGYLSARIDTTHSASASPSDTDAEIHVDSTARLDRPADSTRRSIPKGAGAIQGTSAPGATTIPPAPPAIHTSDHSASMARETTSAPNPAQLGAPQQLTATAGDRSAVFRWDAVPEADGYHIFWSRTPGIHPFTAASYEGFLANPQNGPVTVKDLENGTKYHFVVTANQGTQESAPSPEISVTPEAGPLLIAERYRLEAIDAPTVVDLKTGLEWQRCALGQRWEGATCVGAPIRMTWTEAREAAEAFRHRTSSEDEPWRLPTVDQLQGLVYCSSGMPAHFPDDLHTSCWGSHDVPTLEPAAFPAASAAGGWYWSRTTNSAGRAWGFDFDRGTAQIYQRSAFSGARLVRPEAPNKLD